MAHRPGARRAVVLVGAVAVLPWWLLFSSVLGSRLSPLRAPVAVILLGGLVTAVAWIALLPLEPLGRWVQRRLVGVDAALPRRLQGIAEGLALADGLPPASVALIDSGLPNVFVVPIARRHVVVVATAGVVDGLSRPQLEAIVASQFFVGGDRLVRAATRVQLAMALPFVVIAAAVLVSGFQPLTMFIGFAMVFAFALTTLARRADAVRDLVSDAVAVHTTKDPASLAGALRSLGDSAHAASKERIGVPGFMIDQFAVLSTRSRVVTSVQMKGRTRSWATEDEIVLEMQLRADRIEKAALGDRSGLDSLRGYRRAWKKLGAPGAARSTRRGGH